MTSKTVHDRIAKTYEKEMFSIRNLFIAVLLLFIMATIPYEATAKAPLHYYLGNEEIIVKEPTFMVNNRLYVPIHLVVEQLGAQIQWNEVKDRLKIRSPYGDEYVQSLNNHKLLLNGSVYITDTTMIMKNNRTYLPIRDVAEFMHLQVAWDEKRKVLSFEDIPLYQVVEGETLKEVSKKFNIPKEQLKERNQLQSESLSKGQELKVVIPRVIGEKQDLSDMYLLAKLIATESGGESLKGQIAVGNVVLNRVQDPRFPKTIKDVIYAQNQFEVVSMGILEKKVPNNEAIYAAEKALGGVNYVQDAVYFYNPHIVDNSFFRSLDHIGDIGNHRFAK